MTNPAKGGVSLIRLVFVSFGLLASVAAGAGETQKLQESRAAVPTRNPANIFISGHSLLREPIPSDLESIAKGFGYALDWNQQYLEGSTIEERTNGQREGDYRSGKDRNGGAIDVLEELKSPKEHENVPYETLLITEQHDLLQSLIRSDTVGYLKEFHDAFLKRDPQGATYFYQPWQFLDRKDDPRRWIAYEKAASPMWACVVAQVNADLAADGRSDRIATIPAGRALAVLIERATQGTGVPAISKPTVRGTVDSLIADDVHLTGLGSYYISLVIYASIFQNDPRAAWHPDDVTPAEAAALQSVAGMFVSAPSPGIPNKACASTMRGSFFWTYTDYMSRAVWRKRGPFIAFLLKLRAVLFWWPRFYLGDKFNPFE